ncbi:MAG: hypothetical protein IH851_09340 [Armatimonadetes bacterium]|nr:hypothetical protein [Armatimonadota bacterium]
MHRLAALLLVLAFAVGCARFPGGGGGPPGRRLRFTIRLDGPVNPNFVYMVAIDDDDDLFGDDGPIPVVARPWGNGFMAGQATHFVRYDGFLPSGGYALFKFIDLVNLSTWVLIGLPVDFITPGPDDDTLVFEIDLSQIRPPPGDPLAIEALQINILTMDRVPTDPNDPNPRFWDALGDSRDPASITDYITIDVTTDRIFRNSDFGDLEVQGDVPDPSLDIVDWSIEVRTVP